MWEKGFHIFLSALFFVLALFPQIFSNNKPLLVSEDRILAPAASERDAKYLIRSYLTDDNDLQVEWHKLPDSLVLLKAPLSFNPDYIDFQAGRFSSPDGYHLLGTDGIAHDVMAQIIYSIRTAILIGGAALLTALGLLLLLAVLPVVQPYFRVTLLQLGISVVLGVLAVYYLYLCLIAPSWYHAIVTLILLLFIYIIIKFYKPQHKVLKLLLWKQSSLALVQLIDAIPALIILIVLAASYQGFSSVGLGILIGGLGSAGIIRLARAETLNIVTAEYYNLAISLGYSAWNRVLKVVLPVLLPRMLSALALFTIGAILAEATLSFLGVTRSSSYRSIGSIISQFRQNTDAWWMLWPPTLVLLLLSLNLYYWG